MILRGHEAVLDALRKLDGTNLSAVSLLTGATPEEINELGGVPEDEETPG